MIDRFNYKSPIGLLGVIVDKLFLDRYMRKFIVSRAIALKEIAEKEMLHLLNKNAPFRRGERSVFHSGRPYDTTLRIFFAIALVGHWRLVTK
jgi:hypothetical protein